MAKNSIAKTPAVERELYRWEAAALVIYLLLCALSVWLVARYGTLDPAEVTALDVTLMGLAGFRAVHLITYDKILDMVRAAFMDREGNRLKNAERGWRRLVCEFIQCIWCTGMWSGLIVVTVFFLGPWGRYAIIVLAIAGVASLLQLVSKALAKMS